MNRGNFIRRVWVCASLLLGSAAGLPAEEKDEGLLLPQTKEVRGMFSMNDTQGNQWGISLNYGSIQQSTNSVYGNGLYLQVNNNNFSVNDGVGWMNSAGDEVQIGPWNQQGLTVYRRIKIFPKQGLARWLDIYRNSGSSEVTVAVILRTHLNYGSQGMITSSGANNFGPKDFAFAVQPQGGGAPFTLHVPCGPKAKLRPTVNFMGHRFDTIFRLTIPPGQTVILADLEGQNRSLEALQKIMKGFQPADYFCDLPAGVRGLIANFDVAGGDFEVPLHRSTRYDCVMLVDGLPIFGAIENPSFRLATAWGDLELPAADVVGMAAIKGAPENFQAVLTNGQIIRGRLPDQKLRVNLPAVGVQEIPFADVAEWSYQVNDARPEEIAFHGPYVVLRTGDRLVFQPGSVELSLETPSGVVALPLDALREICLDNPGHGLHKVLFRNGSVLSGLLRPEELSLKFPFGPQRPIPRNQISRLEFATEERKTAGAAVLLLSNGDRLFGRLADDHVVLERKYGKAELRPANILSIRSVHGRLDLVDVRLWNESILRGRLATPRLRFQIEPGPIAEIDAARIVRFIQSGALPPDQVLQKVSELVAQLGAESYEDRKAAQEALTRMGPVILPILQKHLNANDPEVRQRVKDIIEAISPGGSSVGTPDPAQNMEMVGPPGAIMVR